MKTTLGNPHSGLELTHFGHQCPWTDQTMVNLERIASAAGCSFCATDIQSCDLGTRPSVIFPFTVLWNRAVTRTWPVFDSESLESLIGSDSVSSVEHSETLPPGRLTLIERLSLETVDKSIAVCCNGETRSEKKREWYSANISTYHGFVGSDSHGPKVILEFVVAAESPYSVIPRLRNALHIVCLYSNDEVHDYRHEILERFLEEAARSAVKEVYVVVGSHGEYPNGPESFFEHFGFESVQRLGEVRTSAQGSDEVILMKRSL